MSIYAALLAAAIVIFMIIILVAKIIMRPLPDWNGKHGEEYKKWKSNKK
jgi:uncharacterized membrane protein YedE/YeeE